MIPNYDNLSIVIYNSGFDPETFFVQDPFTLSNWTRALKQHIVDIRMNYYLDIRINLLI